MSPVFNTGCGMSSVLYSMKVARYHLRTEVDNEVILDSDFVSAELILCTGFYNNTASSTRQLEASILLILHPHNGTVKDTLRSYKETTLRMPHLNTPYTTY
jgi:hypothetical protein